MTLLEFIACRFVVDDSFWPNSALNSSEIPVQGSSALRRTAEICYEPPIWAASDPKQNFSHLIS